MKIMFQFLMATFLFLFMASLSALAQVVTPAPTPGAAIVPVVVAATGISAWLIAHGGISVAALAILVALNTVLSGVRDLLYFYDGVPKGSAIPANYVGLTKLNIICVWLGKAVDYMQGNVAH